MISKLEKYLSSELYTRFGHLSIRQNYRPDWMEGLELDFYVDEHKIAAEVQGAQHYSFVEFFHKSKEDYRRQQQRDANKKYLCRIHKIELVEIYTEKDADLFVQYLKQLIEVKKQKMPKYFYVEDDLSELSPRKKRKAIIENKKKRKKQVSKLRKQYQQEWNK